jgi:rod shape-determining protein MreD
MTYRLPVWAVLVAAFLVQVAMARLGFHAADMLWAALVYVCMTRSAAASVGAGAVAGLFEDALSGGLYGAAGFSKTLAAYAASRASGMFVTDSAAVRALLLGGGVLFDALVRFGLRALFLDGEGASGAPGGPRGVLVFAAGTTVLGMAALYGLRRVERFIERKKYGRR